MDEFNIEEINFEQELANIADNKSYNLEGLDELRNRIFRSNIPDKEKYLAELDRIISNLPERTKKERLKQMAIHRVAVLVKELIGDRSIRKTAEDTGVAASYITGILKGKYLPSAEILRKLSAPEAKPQHGVTMEDLMIAAGYQSDYVSDFYNEVLHEGESVNNQDKYIDVIPDMDMLSRAALYVTREEDRVNYEAKRKQRKQSEAKFEAIAQGIIFKSLAEKGIPFSMAQDVVGIRGYRPDIAIYSPEIGPNLEWWFEIKYMDNKVSYKKHILSQFMFVEPQRERKITLVINSKEDFDYYCGFCGKLAYRGDLSVILINEEKFTVEREVYLSHYYQEDDSKGEFYLS